MPHINNPEVISDLLTTKARWAVVGLTNNPLRAAVGVSLYLQQHLGMEIIPINPKGESVHGAPGYKQLSDVPGTIDVVDCFVNSSRVGEVIDQAIAIGAKAVWLQLGVVDEAAADRAVDAGLDVVMDTCPKIEGTVLGL